MNAITLEHYKKWNCIPGKFKDYISSPKMVINLYIHRNWIMQKTN